MRGRNIFCGIVAAAIVLAGSIASQAQQKSAKELIAGNWTLMIADNVSREGNNVPGFGPLPSGSARFGADGHYSFEVGASNGSPPAVTSSGTYTLDDAGKTLTLKVEDSSLANWRGTTQTGTVKFISADHLGWTNSVPLVASADFSGTDLIWARAK
jgi:Lipocalin-like domain